MRGAYLGATMLMALPLGCLRHDEPMPMGSAPVSEAGIGCPVNDPEILAGFCELPSIALRAAPLNSTSEAIRIEPSITYGLRLAADPDTRLNGGYVLFRASEAGEHTLYIGTPMIPLEVSSSSHATLENCDAWITANECRRFRRGYRFAIEAGIEYRIALGPIAPENWVRLRIELPTPRPDDEVPIVFAAKLADAESLDLYRIFPDGTGLTRITGSMEDERFPSWSPDHKQIAFIRGNQLVVSDADGSNVFVLSPQVGRAAYTVTAPAWSPGGDWIAYPYPRPPYLFVSEDETVDESYETTLHFVSSDGSADIPFPEPVENIAPPGVGTLYSTAWASNGMLLFLSADDCSDCAGNGAGQWTTARCDGTEYREFALGGPGHGAVNPDWSPDAIALVFGIFAPQWEGNYQGYEEPAALARGDVIQNGVQEVDLGVKGWFPRWSPDGTRIAFLTGDGIYVLDPYDPSLAPRRVLPITGVRGLDW
jgi:hypothetical protein